MSSHSLSSPQYAPCFIESGLILNKEDMKRLLNDLGSVRYCHYLDGQLFNEGEGWIVDVFSDPHHATMVTNETLYLNTHSFDYLEMGRTTEGETYFDLVQEQRQLRLIPNKGHQGAVEIREELDVDVLEAMVNQVLSAKWDVQLDDDCSL